MDSAEVKYILTIAEHRSISKAADALFISQPNLSRILINIEKDLGVKLFDRSCLPIKTTPAGEVCVKYCNQIDALLKSMSADIIGISRHNTPRITIGVPPVRGSYLLPLVLPVFSKAHPDIEVVIKEANSIMVSQMIETGEVDIGIFSLPQTPSNLSCIELLRDPLLLMLPPNHILAYSGRNGVIPSIPLDMIHLLDGERFVAINSPKSITVRLICYLETTYNVHSSIGIRTQSNVMTYRLCELGMGLAAAMGVAIRSVALQHYPCLYKVDNLHEIWNIGIRKERHLSDIERAFIDITIQKSSKLLSQPFKVIK